MKINEPEQITLEQLAKLRSQKGFTAQQVADHMHVSLPIVEHIEQGQFEHIGAAPFIRGHVINYCKCLDIDAAAILSQIPGQLLSHKDVQRPDAFLPASVSRVRLKTNHYGRYAFGTTLLALLSVSAYFVWDKLGEVDGLPLLHGDKETVTYSSILPPVEPPVSISHPQSNNDDHVMVDKPIEDRQTSEAVEQSDDNGAVQQADEQDSQLVSQTADTIADQSSPAFVIEFELQEQAWVSIKTESGDKIIHDLIGPGARRYESDQPMSMRIGNADKLSLSINGKVVDVNAFAVDNLAKFSWPQGS